MRGALLVDAGGILFNNVTEESGFLAELAARYGADAGRLHREIDLRDAAYETNARSVFDVLADALAAAGAPGPPVLDREHVTALYMAGVRAYRPVFDALARIRADHPGLVLGLANNEAEAWDRAKDRAFGHFQYFDVLASSWKLGAVKPSHTYLERLVDACGCRAAEAVFVDDTPEVVAAAAEFGLSVVHVRDPASFATAVPAALHTLGRTSGGAGTGGG
ncbi:HAD family hydrolase [Streptomyces buecherae]|uniref:HAD-IA family hydrolase n=1 Tax=Streptomyces buecherae TaxID=2763006 RepID=A0A7H8NHV7_9ACTN|nr:HAD-IA family hydrolase [Streptomyces buecherae]QKW48229.1 HAD-IA family hydrolase [Streptomyces buecherae]QKW54101.1 HAD-IA family hydrolase [Streptomyces buecherae]